MTRAVALQVRFDRLRRLTALHVQDMEDVVFCPDQQLEGAVASEWSLGTVRALAAGLPGTGIRVLARFQTGGQCLLFEKKKKKKTHKRLNA